MPLAIEIKNLSKVYSNGTKALQDINLEIEQGDFFALLGANGAGKTTIIGILTSLVNKTAGTVKISGVDIDQNFDLAKTYIGVVPQEFNFSIFEKVIDIVTNQGGYYGIDQATATKRAMVILTKLGLKDKMNVVARTLSGGMKRRLMIARALIHEPRILVLDEPTAGVDVELRIGMWEYLNELNADGVTILLTTHYLEEVEQLCKNAAIIKSGQIVKQDTVRNLLNSLDQETYHVEVDDSSKITDLPNGISKLDDHTFEAIIQKGQGLNSIVSLLDQSKIQVLGIRPKGNRLEELFLNIIGE
jgi:ABC-2 type transport system ATP-binding protein